LNNRIIYGGSFDPVHFGHLRIAINVQEKFNFEHFCFLPCKYPVLKNTVHASAEHRMAMLEIALSELPKHLNFKLDRREIERDSPSFMVVTLEDYRKQYGEQISLTLLLGSDSFQQLPKWYQWRRLLELAHLMIIERPGNHIQLSPMLKNLLEEHETNDSDALSCLNKGTIYRFNAGHYPISSTQIREKLALTQDVTDYIPSSVYAYIRKNNLYKK